MYVVVPSIRYSPYISMRLAQVKKVMLNFNCHTIEQSIKLPSYVYPAVTVANFGDL